VKVAILGVLAVTIAAPLAAQVGNPPSESPYRDVRNKQELTAFGGWFAGNEGAAGVGPQAGPAVGVLYEMRIGGPVNLMARLTGVATERTVIDPTKPAATRVLGTERFPMVMAEAGFSLLVTGRKSWHRLIPVVNGGIGVASDLGREIDQGGFHVGTPFALSIGTGVRYVPSTRWQLRVDLTDHLFKLNYPTTYFTPPSTTEDPVLTGSRSEWAHNATLTLGVSYLFGR
jgi:hypothetical protein